MSRTFANAQSRTVVHFDLPSSTTVQLNKTGTKLVIDTEIRPQKYGGHASYPGKRRSDQKRKVNKLRVETKFSRWKRNSGARVH